MEVVMNDIIISVIMGVYNFNSIKLINKSINSILNQSIRKIEFIICDDGSTDDTYDLLKMISRKDDRIILIRNKVNLGLAATLNNCISIAKGKYIARMDIDDVSAQDRLKEQYEFLENNNQFDMVGCSAFIIDADSIIGKRNPKKEPDRKDFLFNSPFIHPTIMIRTEVLKKINGYRIARETTRAEDYDMFMRLYYHNFRGYNLQKYLYYYREDIQSIKKRKYKFRIQEAKVRYIGYKKLKLLPLGYLYIIKPLIVGLIPVKCLQKIRKNISY
jgi:glycosyltransferase EpsE